MNLTVWRKKGCLRRYNLLIGQHPWPVVKQDGSVRICGDYRSKLATNQAESYPLPRIDNIFASLCGGKSFTKLDLAHAYNQIELDEDSKQLVVINTLKGLYRYN